jgi:hypothetical protein
MRRGYLDLSHVFAGKALLDISCGVNHLKMRPKAASSRVTATDRPSGIDRQDRSTLGSVLPSDAALHFGTPVLLLYTDQSPCHLLVSYELLIMGRIAPLMAHRVIF